MLFMCMYWFQLLAPANIESITLTYPVTGHSYINPDRVFGNIEREIKKRACIVQPEELLTIIKKHSEVLYVPDAVSIYDFRSLVKSEMKSTASWPFGIKSCKQIVLRKKNGNVFVHGEPYYFTDAMNGQNLL